MAVAAPFIIFIGLSAIQQHVEACSDSTCDLPSSLEKHGHALLQVQTSKPSQVTIHSESVHHSTIRPGSAQDVLPKHLFDLGMELFDSEDSYRG